MRRRFDGRDTEEIRKRYGRALVLYDQRGKMGCNMRRNMRRNMARNMARNMSHVIGVGFVWVTEDYGSLTEDFTEEPATCSRQGRE